MNDKEQEILFNLEIQIEDDKTANIVIRENDDVEEVVDRFCEEHGYGENIRKVILNQIVEALDQNIEDLEEKNGSNGSQSGENDDDQEEEPEERHEEYENEELMQESLKIKQKESKNKNYVYENDENSDEEYEKYMSHDNTENVLTNEKNDDQRNLSISHPDEIRGTSPEFVNYNYTEDFSNFVVHSNSNENRESNPAINNNMTNLSNLSNITNIANKNIKTNNYNKFDPQTPKSIDSFSKYAIDKDKLKNKENKNTSYNNPALTKNSTNSQPLTKSKSNTRLSTNDVIPGERLYKQYMEKLPKKREHVRKIIDDRKRGEMKEAKFTPSIDRMSEKMASNSPIRKEVERVEDRLLNYGEKKRERIIDEMTKKKLVEYEFPYHPSVGERSQIIATIKRKQRLDNLSKVDYLNKSCDISKSHTNFPNTQGDEVDSEEETRPIQRRNNKLTNDSEVSSFTNLTKSPKKIAHPHLVKNKNQNDTSYNSYERYNTFTTSSKNGIKIKTPSRSRSKNKTRKSKTPVRKNTSQSNVSNSNSNLNKERPRTPVQINPEKSIHDYLYVESKLIKEKKKQEENKHMKKVYPFKPTIPESSKNLVNRVENESQFIKRLVNSKKEAEELIVKIKKKEEANKPQFKPTVGRGPRDPKTREVTVNLNGYYDKKLLVKQNKVKEETSLSNLEKKKLFMEKSTNIILKMKIERYKQIFELLDSDGDGIISSRNIRLSQLDSEMLKTLTPLLENLQKNNLTMNLKEFCLSADQLISMKIFENSNQLPSKKVNKQSG